MKSEVIDLESTKTKQMENLHLLLLAAYLQIINLSTKPYINYLIDFRRI